MGLLEIIKKNKLAGKKSLAVLIDPESTDNNKVARLVQLASSVGVDYFFVGGSTAQYNEMDETLGLLQELSEIPTFIFPGNVSQLNNKADALLYLSLISGRNPDLLIGKQVESVPFLRKNSLEVIPTGYLLIDGGNQSSVAYISNTTPIPERHIEVAVNTALAGQYLGMQLIYLEAGSGALNPVCTQMISAVSQALYIPLIVGGGIRNPETAQLALNAGADLIVIGNILEKDPEALIDISIAVHRENPINS